MVEIKKTLILLLLILSAMCISTKKGVSSPADAESYICPDCNVILISADTLRADHLGTYGYSTDTSPNIDRFASESVLFENAIAQAAWTAPSHMSIMTSFYPSVHKVQRFPNASRLDDSVVTLAQVLKADGYRTVSFNGGGNVGKEFGFGRGFDLYDSPSRDNITMTNDETLNWLSENRDQKFFLFFHTYTVHRPYTPPAIYGYKFFPTYNKSTDRVYTLSIGDEDVDKDEIWKSVALYDGEINYVDDEIGRLLDELDHLNLSDNTIVIFTSDHGEEFFEHGGLDHVLTSYQELIHVPLIIRFPGIENRRIENLAQGIDIMPTVLDSLNITAPPDIQGASLLPLIREGKNVNAYAYSEGGMNGEVKAIISEDLKWKYIYNMERKRKNKELYDLEDDPAEHVNLIHQRPEIAEKLRGELFGQMDENEKLAESYSSGAVELENETRETLKALGYVT